MHKERLVGRYTGSCTRMDQLVCRSGGQPGAFVENVFEKPKG